MRTVSVGVILVAACGLAPAADPPRTFTAGEGPAHLAFSPDGKALAVSSGDSLKLYDPDTGKEVLAFTGNTSPIHAIAFSPDGKLLASGGGGFRDGKRFGEVRVWDAATGKVKLTPEFWPGSDVQAVVYSPDGKSLAAGGLRGSGFGTPRRGRSRKRSRRMRRYSC